MNNVQARRICVFVCTFVVFSISTHAQQTLPPQSSEHSLVWKIAFDRTRVRSTATFQATLTDIYVVDSDGKNEKKLTASGLCHLPNWAPDGLKILFLCLNDEPESAAPLDGDRPDQDIGIIKTNGDGPRILKPGIRVFGEPSWLPDGKTIAIESVRYSKPASKFGVSERGIYTMALDGVEFPHRFLQDVAEARWSPDARKIAYVAYRGNKQNAAIYLADADGSGEQRLTDQRYRAYSLSWSPDSKNIAFTEWRSNRRIICLTTLQSTRVKELTPRKMDAFAPNWSPDGMRLGFSAIRDEKAQVFLINADGTGLRQLTNDKKLSCDHPSWSPDSAQIVFECHAGVFSGRSLMTSPLVLLWPILATPPVTQLYLLNVNAADAIPIELTHFGGSNPRFSPATDWPKVAKTN